MGTAFLGYVLPWGQIRLWAATVITNLLSTIPVLGENLVVWVWGGFAVANPTLLRFYTLHFLLPFIVVALVIIHIFYLHYYTRGNPLGLSAITGKNSFHYFFTVKDGFFFVLFYIFFIIFRCIFGYNFIDPENFIPANPIVTPVHIQPEWYFLFAYAILRSVPNKAGGVLALLASILIMFALTYKTDQIYFAGFQFRIPGRLVFWRFVRVFGLLTWLGSTPAEAPFIGVAIFCSALYFVLFFLLFSINIFLGKLTFVK